MIYINYTTTQRERMGSVPHVVCVPHPLQGHINPMMRLAKILHSQGFHVTFVNTETNHNRLLQVRGPTALNGHPSFRFESIPDSDEEGDDVMYNGVVIDCGGPVRVLIEKLNNDTTSLSGVPNVTCMVFDSLLFSCFDVAHQIGVPAVLLWTAGACSLLGFAQFQNLLDMGIIPFKDANYLTNGQLDMVLNWIPGAEGIRLRDLPSFMRITDTNDFFFDLVIRHIRNCKQASAILLNTYDALEQETIQFIAPDFPPLYTIGPFKLMLDSFDDKEMESFGSNLWKNDPICLNWLDSKVHYSVLYVNFGSLTTMTNEQFLEFAWGLANSKHSFLWITRPDLVIGNSPIIFPSEFLTEIKDRGLIASWCDQEKVLAHQAIGGFLTHNGWNSTIESIYNGVPMICWPFFADQQINCWYCCWKWRIGIEINAKVKRSEVEKQVKELMVGNKGKEIRTNAIKWKKLAREAVMTTSGSSYSNLEKAIQVLLYQT